jgi:hypothetical protein
MQLFKFLFALVWAATLGWAADAEDPSYTAWKAHKSGMVDGKTYVFQASKHSHPPPQTLIETSTNTSASPETPLTQEAAIANDKALQDARNAIGGDHVYMVAVSITSKKTGKPKQQVTTLYASAKYWDMYVKSGTNNVEMHEGADWKYQLAADKGVTYTFSKEMKKTASQVNTACKFCAVIGVG